PPLRRRHHDARPRARVRDPVRRARGGPAADAGAGMTARDVDVSKLRPRSRSRLERDFGLVVGVDHYPRFHSLEGAAADAIAFHAWMCDPDGGGVAIEHACLITSTPEPPRPLQDHV